jgi:hypothetical protein
MQRWSRYPCPLVAVQVGCGVAAMAANRAVTRATGGRWAQRRGVIRTGLKRHVQPGLVQVERTGRAVRLSWRGRH